MLKHAPHLSDDYEYAFVWWGQSNANPQGLRADGETELPDMALRANGTDVTLVSVPVAQTGLQTLTALDDYSVTFNVSWVGAEFRVGRPNYPNVGYGTITAQTDTSLTVDFDVAPPATAGLKCYITFADGRHNQLPNVRVLTPYLPEGSTDYPGHVPPQLPGGTVDVTSYEDLAMFLPFNYMEGVSGFGISEVGGTGLAVSAAALSFEWTHSTATDALTGWTVTVEHAGGTSSAVIASNTPTIGTLVDPGGGNGWTGAGTPSGTPNTWTYILTDPEFNYEVTHASGGGGNPTCAGDNTVAFPFALAQANLLAGGHAYLEWTENATGDKKVSWGSIASSALSAFTVSAWLGDGTPDTTAGDTIDRYEAWIPHYWDSPHARFPGYGFRYPSNESTPIAAVRNRTRHLTGWQWNFNRFGALPSTFWSLANGLGKRVNVIPLAVSASSIMITQTLFGGTTCGWWSPEVRCDWHPQTANGLATRMARLISTIASKANAADGNTKPLRILGIVGFQGEAEAISVFGREQYKNLLPMFYGWLRTVIQASGLSYYDSADEIPIVHPILPTSPWEIAVAAGGGGDTDGQVNSAIRNFAAKVPFVGTFDTNDSPQKSGEEIHFNGAGEAINGQLAAAEMLKLVDSYASTDIDLSHPIVASICNVALTYVGEPARITNLATDQSIQGQRCQRFFASAVELLLLRCSWSFATRRGPLESVDDTQTSEWSCAYGYPDTAIRVFSVLPEQAGDDYSVSLNAGTLTRNAEGLVRAHDPVASGYTPQKFTVEQDDDGHRVIYTNVENAVGRWNVRVTDVTQFSSAFKHALSLQIGSLLSGVTMAGEEGIKVGRALELAMERYLGEAKVQDAIQHDVKPAQAVSWMAARRGGY